LHTQANLILYIFDKNQKNRVKHDQNDRTKQLAGSLDLGRVEADQVEVLVDQVVQREHLQGVVDPVLDQEEG
jgi:hypothetical protein